MGWPVFMTFYPDIARAALQYRADRQKGAAINAGLSRGPPTLPFNLSFEGLLYPWMTALTGLDNDGPNAAPQFPTEDHLDGDISLAFQQYWQATHNLTWLKKDGYSVIHGIATFWASRVTQNVDGTYSI